MSLDCSIPRPSIADLQEQIKTELSMRILGGAPVLPMSNEDILAFVMAGSVNLMWGYVNQGLKESDPEQMCCDNLVAYAARRGIYMQSADRARGLVIVTGVPGAEIPDTIRFVGESSKEYKLDQSYMTNPTQIGTGGSSNLYITAAGGGLYYNAAGGTALTVSTTIPGIDLSATVAGNGLVGGADAETCDELRARVMRTLRNGPVSANVGWFIDQTMKWPGVTRACSDECEQCCDMGLTLYPFMDGAYEDGIPPPSVIDAMNLWMFGPARTHGEGLAPIGVVGRYQAAAPTILKIVVTCMTGCAPSPDSRIAAAVNEVIARESCVGSAICLSHLEAAAAAAVGGEACLARIEFNFDETLSYRNDAFAYLACGRFLKLQSITVKGAGQ